MAITIQKNPESIKNTTNSQRLRTTMAAIRLAFTWFGTRKLSNEQKSKAADTFGAEREILVRR